MTIESTVSAQTFLGDGVQRSFPFSFQGWAGEMLVLTTDTDGVETDVTERATITFNDTSAGGVAQYPASTDAPALPSGWKITVLRRMDFLQDTSLETPRRFDGAVIEERLDRLTAQDQELREDLRRAIKVAVSSPGDPPSAEELYAEVARIADQARLAAQQAEDAVTRAGEAVLNAEEAVDTAEASSASANAASLVAQDAAAEASAAMSKLLGMTVVVEFVGSETPPSGNYNPDTGILTIRIPAAPGGGGSVVVSDSLTGSRTAEDGVAASEWALAQVNAKTEAVDVLATTANNRADEAYALADSVEVDVPLATDTTPGIVKPDGVTTEVDPITGALSAKGGARLLSLDYSLTGALAPGYLFLGIDNGILTKDSFRDAYAQLVQDKANGGAGILIGEVAWQVEKAANGGKCAKFMLDESNETFRVPFIPGLFFRCADQSKGILAGDYQSDAIRNFTGSLRLQRGGTITPAQDGVLASENGPSYALSSFQEAIWGNVITIDASRQVPTAEENRPENASYPVMIKMYGVVTNAGSADIAALIQLVTERVSIEELDARLEAVAPKPQSGEGVGQWRYIISNTGVLQLPAGGTWTYHGFSTGANAVPAVLYGGIAAGGATLPTGGQTYCTAWVWRIA